MSDDATIENEWDFYPCRVDGEPASILINLRFRYEDPTEQNDHVHHAFIRMAEPGPQGLGTREEMDRLTPIEDTVFDRVEQAGGQPVGRLRYQGIWQLSVYGPKDMPWSTLLAEVVGAPVDVQSQEDAEAAYLNEFLLPDEERLQWIMDRRVCDQLRHQGDDLQLPRPVDHFIEYEETAPPELLKELRVRGFDVTDTGEGLECIKVHDARLETVHEITMELSELADSFDAAYSGWGAPVTKPGSGMN